MSDDTPEDVFEDMLGLCAKVLHDNEQPDGVFIDDLVELRGKINAIRQKIATSGYSAFPRIRKTA